MKGQVIRIISDMHTVSYLGNTYECKCRGNLRYNKTIPLVGDYVEFSISDKVIDKILPRKNEFRRPAVSNIDQAFLITSVKEPNFSYDLLNKLLVWMELHNVDSIICITKEDLLSEEEKKKYDEIFSYYKKIGYQVISNTDYKKLKTLIKNKVSVFTGQTGAGKSTLLNKLNPNWNLKTGEISKALGRGRHTTRTTEIFELFDGQVVDTPGFSALSFDEYSEEEIKNAFIEFNNYKCPYKDCNHIKEVKCQVKDALLENKIDKNRYNSYIKLIERR